MENNQITMMTIKEAAEKTGLAAHFIRQLVLQNKIVYVSAGRKYLLNYEKLLDYLNTGEQCPQGVPQNKIRQLH